MKKTCTVLLALLLCLGLALPAFVEEGTGETDAPSTTEPIAELVEKLPQEEPIKDEPTEEEPAVEEPSEKPSVEDAAVDGEIVTFALTEPVYSVDITWGEANFTYQTGEVWNPKTLTYATQSGWSPEAGTVTVENHSICSHSNS